MKALALSAALLATTAWAPIVQQEPNNKLSLPAGATLVLSVHAAGVQVYTAKPKDGKTFEWALKGPQATLYDKHNKKAGTHTAGPTWTLADGSSVVGQQPPLAKVEPESKEDVPALLLGVKSHAGSGKLDQVSYIIRTDVVGGAAPTAPPTQNGQEAKSKYRATYLFFARAR